jgi:hypothetical protein
MPIPNIPIDASASSWLSLLDQLRQCLDRLSWNQWRWVPNLDVPRNIASDEWMAFHWEDRIAVDSWCETFLREGTLETKDPQLVFQVQCRFWMAYHLLGMMTYARNIRVVSPFPAPTDPDFLCRLLVEWWHGVGQFHAFDQAYDSKLIFDLEAI